MATDYLEGRMAGIVCCSCAELTEAGDCTHCLAQATVLEARCVKNAHSDVCAQLSVLRVCVPTAGEAVLNSNVLRRLRPLRVTAEQQVDAS